MISIKYIIVKLILIIIDNTKITFFKVVNKDKEYVSQVFLLHA